MKILMLNYEYPPLGGGAGNATCNVLREFSRYDDLQIDLVTSSTAGFREEVFSGNIRIYFLDICKRGNLHYQTNRDLLNYACRAYLFCKRLSKENRYDLCHAFFGIPCGLIAMKLNMPYIVSLRGSDVPFFNKRFEVLDKFIFQRVSRTIWKRSKAVIANSEGLRCLALKTSPEQKISVIYNGVDTDEFRPLRGKEQNERIMLISVGRLIHRKGYEYLIRALRNQDNFHLNLIGDGNLRGALEGLSKECNSPVTFLGKVDQAQVRRHLQESDIFVLPSLNEGMSNSILEAMACGLPVISTDVGGSVELIRENGHIVRKASTSAIMHALNKYRENRSLIEQHGHTSRTLAEKMSWESVARQYMEVYRHCRN